MNTTSTSARIALVSALACAGAWSAKGIAIGVAGGLDRSPFEGPLFLLGLAAYVVAVVALCLALTADRSAALRVAAVVAGVVAAFGVTTLVEAAVGTVRPTDPSWVWSEVGLWVAAAVLVTLATRVTRGRGRVAAAAV